MLTIVKAVMGGSTQDPKITVPIFYRRSCDIQLSYQRAHTHARIDLHTQLTQQAHEVYTTSSQRCIDVEPTLHKRHVPAGEKPVYF